MVGAIVLNRKSRLDLESQLKTKDKIVTFQKYSNCFEENI